MDKEKCNELLKEFIILPTRSLGQNFLINDAATKRIIEEAGIRHSDQVLEIGPGIGALTVLLGQDAARVIAVEIDAHLIDALTHQTEDLGNVEVVCRDFLKFPRREGFPEGGPDVIVSNLPYYVMTPIMLKLFREWECARTMVFTVEDDACDRIFAEPGDKSYGPLSVFSSLYGKKEKLFLLDSKSFYPAPHTQSAVIRFSSEFRLETAPSVLFPLVHASFAMRRKTILNALSSSGLFPDGKKVAAELLLAAGVPLEARAEELHPETFLRLAGYILDAHNYANK